MAKLKLGSAPKNFKRMIHIPLVDGTTADLEISFKYRTRTEFGELIDSIVAKPSTEKEEVKQEIKTTKEAFKKGNESEAENILKMADGWDLDEPFNKANIVKLIDEFPVAATIISDTYRELIQDGRAKN